MNETDPVIFTCSATGIPPPEITWMKNGMPFSNTRVTITDPTMPELYSTDGGNIFLVSRNLSLDNAMNTDSGTYTCVASNGNIVQQTQNFDLFVNGMSKHDVQSDIICVHNLWELQYAGCYQCFSQVSYSRLY